MDNLRERLYWNKDQNFVAELVELSKSKALVRSIFDLRRNVPKFNNGLILMEIADFQKLEFIDFNNIDNFEKIKMISKKVISEINTSMDEMREEIYVQH